MSTALHTCAGRAQSSGVGAGEGGALWEPTLLTPDVSGPAGYSELSLRTHLLAHPSWILDRARSAHESQHFFFPSVSEWVQNTPHFSLLSDATCGYKEIAVRTRPRWVPFAQVFRSLADFSKPDGKLWSGRGPPSSAWWAMLKSFTQGGFLLPCKRPSNAQAVGDAGLCKRPLGSGLSRQRLPRQSPTPTTAMVYGHPRGLGQLFTHAFD